MEHPRPPHERPKNAKLSLGLRRGGEGGEGGVVKDLHPPFLDRLLQECQDLQEGPTRTPRAPPREPQESPGKLPDGPKRVPNASQSQEDPNNAPREHHKGSRL